MRFANRTVVVTGSGSGIGRVVAKRFAAEGGATVIADLFEDKAREVAAEIEGDGLRAFALRADVSAAADVDAMVRLAEDTFGPVDVLVNNAYSCEGDNVVLMDEATWEKDIAGVLKSAFLCSRRVLRSMIERRSGVIVNIASVNGLAYVGNEAYSAGNAQLDAVDRRPLRPLRSSLRRRRTGLDRDAGLAGARGEGTGHPRAPRQVVPPRAGRNSRGRRERSALPRFRRGFVDHRDGAAGGRRPPRGERRDDARAPRRVPRARGLRTGRLFGLASGTCLIF
jgi:NADP-dependent 3-hydroxy acid dehydrogenase YdfG